MRQRDYLVAEPALSPPVTKQSKRGVLIVDLAAGRGGAEKRVVQLASGLTEAGVEVAVVCLEDAPLAAQLERYQLVPIKIGCGKRNPMLVRTLRRIMLDHPGWVVDAHNSQSQLWCVFAAAAARVSTRVATVHSEYSESERRLFGLPSWHEPVLSLARRSGWRFIAVTDSVERYVHDLGVRPERISTIWSSVEPPQDVPLEAGAQIRQEMEIAPNAFVVVTVGRLIPVKRHALLLEAISRMSPAVPHVHLVLAGDGPERATLENRATELGIRERVRFLGHREDVPRLLAASDMCALTSATEGLPYALLEAAASRVPIVATRVGAIESVFKNGWSAILVEPGNLSQVIESLELAVTQPALLAELAERAHQHILATLDYQKMLMHTLNAYDPHFLRDKGSFHDTTLA